jgi:carbon monoxide dehydrogenase subunit G
VAAADGTYNMKMKVALAALSGDFIGKVAMEDLVPPASYRLRVEGAGRIGFLNGQGELRLSSVDAGSTLVTYQGEVHTGGTIAAVGQRLVDSTARMMIRRFFERLDTILQVAS